MQLSSVTVSTLDLIEIVLRLSVRLLSTAYYLDRWLFADR